VIISMSLTPMLAEAASAAGDAIESRGIEWSEAIEAEGAVIEPEKPSVAPDSIVVCGYGEVGRTVCEAIRLADNSTNYVVFDLNLARVANGLRAGSPIIYGDGSSASVLHAAGIEVPRKIIVTYSGAQRCADTVQKLHANFPSVRIYTRAREQSEVISLLEAGAAQVMTDTTEAAARLAASAMDVPTSANALRVKLQDAHLSKATRSGAAVLPFGGAELEDLLAECNTSETAVRDLYQTFTSIDKDASGSVDLEEVTSWLKRSDAMLVDDNTLSKWIVDADNGGDGTIDFKDFVKMASFAK